MQLKDMSRQWWKEGVVYQIYPRSFQDSNGDGIGDLRGIIQRLDYIASLGVDIVWLNPIYKSPNYDNGYDISDYRDIMDDFGTMSDFEEMLAGFHARGIKVVMDLVVNHSSSEHEWFKASRSSRDNPYRDYYHWWPAEKGTPPERWSYFDEQGSAWAFDEQTNAYYLHYFDKTQPDLNWENPKVRQEIFDMMHYWFKKGIDGFRMDVITFISKHDGYPEFEGVHGDKMIDEYASGPRLHQYLHEMNREVLQHYDIMTVAEGPGTNLENIHDLVDEDREELNMNYHFEHVELGLDARKIVNDDHKDLVKFKKIMSAWATAFDEKGWGTQWHTNHDFPRQVTWFGDDSPEHREQSSKLLSTFLLTMRGTPYYYMGDEIGMTNAKFESIEDYNDLMTINWYNLTVAEGGDAQKLLESHKLSGRDNARTPFQWDSTTNAGFSEGTPWLKVTGNYTDINVSAQEGDPNSPLNYFRKLTKLRKDNLTLVYGAYNLLLPDDKHIYAYTRSLDDEVILVVLNYSSEEQVVQLPEASAQCEVLINNYQALEKTANGYTLAPWQAVVLRLE
ncbi:MAG: oligo-1,6-glucosidase [Alteromonas sp. Nap_26]|nr:MAG: oligo-1,6-glucosidase [Alteromonas sp. Nap_26]